jgi:hypothetical protein
MLKLVIYEYLNGQFTMIMIMSIGWDYVSELRLRTGPVDILAWNNMVECYRQGKLLICPPELSGSPTYRDI